MTAATPSPPSVFTLAERNQRRYQLYGAAPETPFYGEPLDVRVTIVGSVSQNMPAPISARARRSNVPNLTLIYDPIFATGRVRGFQQAADTYVRYIRVQPDPVNAPAVTVDYPLPPMPRLPVSPTLPTLEKPIRDAATV